MSTDLIIDSKEELFEVIAAALERQGYVVISEGLSANLVGCLLALHAEEGARFSAGGIGRGQGQVQNLSLRRDKIAWIPTGDARSEPWHEWTSALRSYLNRRLFLGLFSFESHLARYLPGDFYKTHLDAFRGQSNRRLSLVTYLNESWRAEQGGELVIYHPGTGSVLERVLPQLGTLVLFLSEEFPHEVLPATRDRLSVAGWFRVNSSTAGHVDPPA